MNFTQLQLELKEWSAYNFPNRPSWQPFLGMQEELGEIAHSFLKMSQGIRGTEAEHLAKIEDGIGDLVIYACDFANAMNFDLFLLPVRPKDVLPAFRLLIHLQSTLGNVSYCWIHEKLEAIDLNRFIVYIAFFADSLDIDFEQAVEKTWAQVKQRDWQKARKENGGHLD